MSAADGWLFPSSSLPSLATTACVATCTAAAVVVAASSVVIAANSVSAAEAERANTPTPQLAATTTRGRGLVRRLLAQLFFSSEEGQQQQQRPPRRRQNGKFGHGRRKALDNRSSSCTDAIMVDESDPARQSSAEKPDPYSRCKRNGYLSWDDYFMAVAFLSSQRSKDPNRQVGACIVNANNIILGIGYNGFPRGIPDDILPWAKMSKCGNVLETKFPYVVHAEANAILNSSYSSIIPTADVISGKKKSGQRVYVTLFPCCECAKLIVQAGIDEVVYFDDKNMQLYTDDEDESEKRSTTPAPKVENGAAPSAKGSKDTTMYMAAARILKLAGVCVRQHKPARSITLAFDK